MAIRPPGDRRSGGLAAGLNAVLGPAPAPLQRTPPPFRAAVPTY